MYAIGVLAEAGLATSLTHKILLGQSGLDHKIAKGLVVFCPIVLHLDNIPGTYKSIHKLSTENRAIVPVVDGNLMCLFITTHAKERAAYRVQAVEKGRTEEQEDRRTNLIQSQKCQG